MILTAVASSLTILLELKDICAFSDRDIYLEILPFLNSTPLANGNYIQLVHAFVKESHCCTRVGI